MVIFLFLVDGLIDKVILLFVNCIFVGNALLNFFLGNPILSFNKILVVPKRAIKQKPFLLEMEHTEK